MPPKQRYHMSFPWIRRFGRIHVLVEWSSPCDFSEQPNSRLWSGSAPVPPHNYKSPNKPKLCHHSTLITIFMLLQHILRWSGICSVSYYFVSETPALHGTGQQKTNVTSTLQGISTQLTWQYARQPHQCILIALTLATVAYWHGKCTTKCFHKISLPWSSSIADTAEMPSKYGCTNIIHQQSQAWWLPTKNCNQQKQGTLLFVTCILQAITIYNKDSWATLQQHFGKGTGGRPDVHIDGNNLARSAKNTLREYIKPDPETWYIE